MGHSYNAVMTEEALIQSREWAESAFDVADERQASHIVLLDVREACDFADYFVIMTADSSRQLRTLVEDLEQGMEDVGASLHHVEGTHTSGWILMDYGDVLVHLMGPRPAGLLRAGDGVARGASDTCHSLIQASVDLA